MTTALHEAAWVYENQRNYDRQQRFDAAVSLGEWGIYSYRQIGAIVGLSHSTVSKLIRKPEKTGGTFSPECLAPLLELSKRRRAGGDLEPDDLRDMLAAGTGTSVHFAARLSGIAESYIRRQIRKE